MMTNEKLCLRWTDFESNISGALRELREDQGFYDVTLACDEDQIQAHKVIQFWLNFSNSSKCLKWFSSQILSSKLR